MTHLDPDFLAQSQAVFRTQTPPTLADVQAAVCADTTLNPAQKRDLLSALKRFAAWCGKPLTTQVAKPEVVRAFFLDACPARLQVSEKTLANIRSLVIQAVDRYGPPIPRLTRRFPPNAPWQALLDRIDTDFQRQALYRLATYCTVMNISPDLVGPDTLVGLHAALVAEEAVKDPRDILRNTITNWNRSARTIPGWPQIRLTSPFATDPWTLPLTVFPQRFQAEVDAWAERMLHPDPLDDDAPPKPLRPATVEARILTFRQFATSVVKSGLSPVEDITSLAVMLELDAFKAGLRMFLTRNQNQKTQHLHNMANTLRLIAQHHCRFDEATLKEMERVCQRLAPDDRRQMTAKNRERLRQFDDPKNVALLLHIPDREAAQAAGEKNPIRAAKHMERALAVSLLIHCGLRLMTLRTLELAHFASSGPRCTLFIPGDNTKTGRPLEFELSDELQILLQRHLRDYRPRLPGADGPYLFPGHGEKARSKNAMYEAICTAVTEAGLEMNPHLFRHALAKIMVERDPGAYVMMSRVLGHTSLDTTTAHYLGTESKAAGRHLDDLLANIKTGKK